MFRKNKKGREQKGQEEEVIKEKSRTSKNPLGRGW